MNNETKINEEDLFKLSAPVGRGKENDPLDVAKVESIMGATGHLDIEKTDGPTGYFGERLEDAVKSFQNEEKLKVDGLVKPEGETVKAILADALDYVPTDQPNEQESQQPGAVDRLIHGNAEHWEQKAKKNLEKYKILKSATDEAGSN